MIRKHFKAIGLGLLILIVGGGLLYIYRGSDAEEVAANPRSVITVTKGSLAKTIAAEGYVRAATEETLSFPVKSSGSTKLEKIAVSEGERVEKRQLLASLNKTEANLKYNQKLNTYNRTRINGSKTEIEEARLELELAQDELHNMEITAPFAGVITEIYVEEGDYFTSGDVLTIKDTSKLEVEVSIEESAIPNVRLGQKALIMLGALPGVAITGQVTEIANEANAEGSTVTLPVVVTLDEVHQDIILNTTADLDIIVGQADDQIIVPITAIVSQGGQDFVNKVVGGKTALTPVETGLTNGLRVVIISGLNEGDQISVNTFRQAQPSANTQNAGGQVRQGGVVLRGPGGGIPPMGGLR